MLSFVAVAMVVIATPGPDTALTVRNTLTGGRRSGVSTGMGVAAGQCVWTVLTAVGVSGLVAASDAAFTAIKVAGAVYLAWLGARALLDAWRGHETTTPHPAADPASERGSRAAEFKQGLYSNLGNPKMAAFFTSLLPQFAPDASPPALLGLGALFALLTAMWLSLYAVAMARFRRVFEWRSVRRTMDAVLGAALVGLAARLLGEQRA